MFLAHIWGPAILAVGLGIFLSREYYVRVYRDLQKEPLALLLLGVFAIIGGITQITFHNTWSSLPEIIISLTGWGLLLKGLICTIAPGWVDEVGDWEVKSNLVPLAGALTLLIGLYLTWTAYMV